MRLQPNSLFYTPDDIEDFFSPIDTEELNKVGNPEKWGGLAVGNQVSFVDLDGNPFSGPIVGFNSYPDEGRIIFIETEQHTYITVDLFIDSEYLTKLS